MADDPGDCSKYDSQNPWYDMHRAVRRLNQAVGVPSGIVAFLRIVAASVALLVKLASSSLETCDGN